MDLQAVQMKIGVNAHTNVQRAKEQESEHTPRAAPSLGVVTAKELVLLYSAATDHLIYPTDKPLALLSQVQGGRRVADGHIAVPVDLPNLQALTKAGLTVIPPMEHDGYDWPIRRPWQPLAHQKITANFLALNPRCFCLNDMGTMKTLSALWAADYLMELHRRRGLKFRALIVAPLSILRMVWEDAIYKNFLGRRKCVVLHGSADKRRKLLEKDVDFYIINHDGLSVGLPTNPRSPLEGLAKDLSLRGDIRLAIVDEAAVYRDSTTRRHRAARTLLVGRDYFWLMTGTPTPNGPVDAYGQAKLVNNAYGETWTNYRARVMMHISQFKWLPRQGSHIEARKLLSPAVRFAAKDVLDLPPCTMQRREASLSTTQAQALKTLKSEAVLAMKSGALVHAVNEAALRMKLIQVVCGAVYDTAHDSHDLDPAPRIAVLEEIFAETDRKIVVFAPLTNVLNMLYTRLKGKYECAIINGHVKGAARDEVLRRFGDAQDPLRVAFVDPGTVSHGVNQMVTANICVWYGPTDKSELWQQGNKRVDRPGQTAGSTTIVQIVATKIEDEIFDRLEANETMQGVILKLAEEA